MNKKILNRKLQQIINDLKPYSPEKVILYGSQSRGDAGKYSDIDLLVIKKTNQPRWQRIKELMPFIYKQQYFATSKFPGLLDIKIYTPKELRREIDLGDFFIEEVMSQGKIIYERK